MRWLCLGFSLLLVAPVRAAETRLKNESELGISVVSGNANSENYSLKQLSTYQLDDYNLLKGQGRYVQGRTSGVESARAWEALIRLEHTLSDWWSVFVSQTAESDVFGGYIQRDSTDLGLKYYLIKEDDTQAFAEAGYRYQFIRYVASDDHSHGARAYLELSHKLSPSASAKLWVEYIPSFKDNEEYLVNGEPSLTMLISEVFSLKSSYLVKYQNPSRKTASLKTYTDTTFLTTLVAKF